MREIVLVSLFLMIPAGIANMTPVLVKKFPFLNYPIDGGKTWNGRPILGSHKTWRGLICGTIAGIVAASILCSITNHTYDQHTYLAGFLLGLGALVGDLVKSLFKRYFEHPPGTPWFPFDQIDWVLGALLFYSILEVPALSVWIFCIVVFGVLHVVFNYTAYLLHLKENKF